MKYQSNVFIKIGQGCIIYINIIFMKLVEFNKLILNIKVAFNNLLVSLPYSTWGWTFFPISNYFLFWNHIYFPLQLWSLLKLVKTWPIFPKNIELLNRYDCCYAKVLKGYPKMGHQFSKHSQIQIALFKFILV
jgi:hypothetical protein